MRAVQNIAQREKQQKEKEGGQRTKADLGGSKHGILQEERGDGGEWSRVGCHGWSGKVASEMRMAAAVDHNVHDRREECQKREQLAEA